MKSDSDTLVSITKVEKNIESAVKKAINQVGGMDSVVREGDKIYLKPNFVAPRHSSTGATTDLEVIRIVAEEVRRCGGTPILYETPAIEFDKKTVYDFLGVYELAKRNNIELVDSKSDLISVPVPNGIVFKKVTIPQILRHAKIINLPKLKTHVNTKMTCGLKNLIGLLPDSEKRRIHIRGVDATVADLSKVFRPILTVVDASACQQGDGPTYGDKIDLGLIVAGKNMVAVDKICSQIIGLPWDEVKYLRLLDGHVSQSKIGLTGTPIEEITLPFNIPEKSSFYQFSTRMIHALDVIFSKIFSQHLNEFLYSTGYFGTNPKILRDSCDRCGHCLEVCPVEDAMDLDTYRVDYKNCIRCLDCYFACDKNAIAVKGLSRPDSH